MKYYFYQIQKRLLDVVLGSLLLLLSTPLILIASLAIRFESIGNPFFIQKRVGLKGKPFKLIKLRGMYVDSKIRFSNLYEYDESKGLNFYFHIHNDPRVTRVGAFIRSYSIDELPNFINVIFGTMSLVGPRPEIPDVIALYGEYRDAYLSVKPGITCISKCTGRDSLTKYESLKLDLLYVENKSFMTDLSILLRTFLCVIARKNVY
jgi:lipopolysaccharide/colanic/teichoic acid biosynthesis glycosyltransferase